MVEPCDSTLSPSKNQGIIVLVLLAQSMRLSTSSLEARFSNQSGPLPL